MVIASLGRTHPRNDMLFEMGELLSSGLAWPLVKRPGMTEMGQTDGSVVSFSPRFLSGSANSVINACIVASWAKRQSCFKIRSIRSTRRTYPVNQRNFSDMLFSSHPSGGKRNPPSTTSAYRPGWPQNCQQDTSGLCAEQFQAVDPR